MFPRRTHLVLALVTALLAPVTASADTTFTFTGHGYGHGVGLDQWRAKTMADLGYDASQILQYYYPGAALSSLR